jgi:hypothetical protein
MNGVLQCGVSMHFTRGILKCLLLSIADQVLKVSEPDANKMSLSYRVFILCEIPSMSNESITCYVAVRHGTGPVGSSLGGGKWGGRVSQVAVCQF